MRQALPSLLVILVSSTAFAQPTRPAPAPPPAASASNLLAIPPPPVVDDPMLGPVPAPTRVVASWQEALAYVRARSTDLRVALDQVLQAEAQTRVALAAYLPTINATGSLTHNLITKTNAPQTYDIKGTFNGAPFDLVVPPAVGATSTTVPTPTYLSGNIQATQALINVQAFDQISISELGEDAAKLSVEDEKRTLLLSVANQMVSVVTAERAAEINRVGLRVALEQLAISSAKRSLGAANGLDVIRAQQNAANARATLVTGDEALREAREALGLALGIPEETGVAHDINVDGMAENAMASCRVVTGVDERADVAAGRTKLEIAKRSLRNVYFQFLPTLTAASAVSTTGQPLNAFPSTTWNIQGILSVPIWDGGARYGQLRNARAGEDVALQQLEALRRSAIIQVQQAQRQLFVAEESAKVAREQRDLAAQNDQMTQTAYTVGQGTSLELVTASEAHRQAELNLALQEFGVVKARILAMLALATCPW
jgi:multidrug efflux system outer membrane protein